MHKITRFFCSFVHECLSNVCPKINTMPTFTIVVREKNKRKDGKYPVSIRLTHKRQSVNIPIDTYVQRYQINAKFTGLKDAFLVRQINNDIIRYEDILLKELGTDLSRYTAKELANIIAHQRVIPEGGHIDFADFCRTYIMQLKQDGRTGTASRLDAVLRNLVYFFGRENFSVKEINVKNIQSFIEWLSKPRKVAYVDKNGRKVEITREPCKAQTVKDYVADVQTLFNAAKDKYNDEDTGVTIISHNPFRSKKVRIEVREQPSKRDLTIEELVMIAKADNLPTARMQLARDVLMLSFYLLAMNTADMYGEDATINVRRVQYHRQKTMTRRKDEALFSVKIEPEAIALMRKYRDPDKKRLFRFYKMYSSFRTFNSNVNIGCKQLAQHLGLAHPLSSYYARHSWATIASEDCSLSDEEVALALNHVGTDDMEKGKSLRVTRGYIHRKFKKNDINNRKVLDLLASKLAR